MTFEHTTSISEILEHSHREPVIIFKYSNDCGTSDDLVSKLENAVAKKSIISPIYKITVQDQPTLSKNIAEHFEIKHETPQIIILNKAKVTYTAHHRGIKVADFAF